MEQKTITFSFRHFLDEHCLGELDSVPVHPLSGELIKACDTTEELVHVQFHKLEHLRNFDWKNPPLNVEIEGDALNQPIVWWKKAWDIHYPKIVGEKVAQFSNRKKENITSENIERIAKKLRVITGLPLDSCKPIAIQMWKNPDKAVLKELGIYIEEV